MSFQLIPTQLSEGSGIASATSAASANPARISYTIQNLGTNALFVKEGAGASTSDFHRVLAAGAGNDDGSGGSYDSPSGQVYTGVITIAGTTPRYVLVEREMNA